MLRKYYFPVPPGHWEKLHMECEWVGKPTAHLKLRLLSGEQAWTVYCAGGDILVVEPNSFACCGVRTESEAGSGKKRCKRCLAALEKIKQSYAWQCSTVEKRCKAKADKLKHDDPIGAWVVAHMPSESEKEAMAYAKHVTSLAPPLVPSPLNPEDVPRLGRVSVLKLIDWRGI